MARGKEISGWRSTATKIRITNFVGRDARAATKMLKESENGLIKITTTEVFDFLPNFHMNLKI